MSLPEIDTFLFFFINTQLSNTLFDICMPFITSKSYLLYLPLFAWLVFKEQRKALVALMLGVVSLLLADWAGHMLKDVIERTRPCHALEGVRLLVGCGQAYSMPSNHAIVAFALILPFYRMFKSRARYLFLAVALMVGFSRMYIGVHYPSDVVAGAALGVLISLSVMKGYSLSSERYREKPYTTVLFLFLLAISLFRIYYIQYGPLDLSPDEAHYWDWSRRLDMSYYSKGPMIAYLIFFGTSLFGDTVFGVRILAVVFSALSSIFLYTFGKRIYDEEVGLYSALLLQIIPLFSTFGIIFTIDSPFIFFWTLSLFLFWQAINHKTLCVLHNEEKEKPFDSSVIAHHSSLVYWLLLGVSIGFGLLTKYTMAFFYLCAFLFLLFSKEQRNLLLTKGPSSAFITSLIVFSPVILWNAGHDWVTFRHTAGQIHAAEGFTISLSSLLEFLGSQFGVITPLLFVLALISLWKMRKDRGGNFLFWFSVPVLVFFFLKSIQAKVQANWALPGYISGIAAFSACYIRGFFTAGKGKKILIAAAVSLSLFMTAVAHYPSLLRLPVAVDPTARLDGWKELGDEVTGIYEQMSQNRPVFIFSDRYQVTSQLAFYVKGHPVTYCVNLGRRMNQYDLWPGFFSFLHHDAIFVRTGDKDVPEAIAAAFEKVEKKVISAYTKKHAKIRDYSIFLCYDFKGLREEKQETY
jgi:4-amino-4-deoxy-L-arabinose transferase-like glycosyltransferase/membrane-associated phospholipid phosphatase